MHKPIFNGTFQHPKHDDRLEKEVEALAPQRAQKKGMAQALVFRARRGQLHIYAGTVPAAEIAKRRAKNRVARKQRRVNRLRGA